MRTKTPATAQSAVRAQRGAHQQRPVSASDALDELNSISGVIGPIRARQPICWVSLRDRGHWLKMCTEPYGPETSGACPRHLSTCTVPPGPTPGASLLMTFTQAVRSALGNYATFSGRARRSEYWWFYLFTILVGLVTSVVDAVLNTAFNNEIGIVGTIISLALLLPSLAVTARRLHDTGRTGWWMMLPVVPLLTTIVVGFAAVLAAVFSTDTDGTPAVALIVLLVASALLTLVAFITVLVFLCLDSNHGPNKYGPTPKQPPPMLPTESGGYYPPDVYSSEPPSPGNGEPYGYPQQSPTPPNPGSYRPQA